MGFTQGAGYALASLGPLLFGALHEATGGWAWPFAMLATSVAGMAAGGWLACSRGCSRAPGRPIRPLPVGAASAASLAPVAGKLAAEAAPARNDGYSTGRLMKLAASGVCHTRCVALR